jgi:DNA repair exonuclease SbcCD ATPase subunit
MNLNDIKEKLVDLKSEQRIIERQIDEANNILGDLIIKKDNHTKAKWVLVEVQRLTQLKFKEHVEKLVTMAIKSIFDRPFTFHLEFEYKRNKLECRPVVRENGNEYDPVEDMGGGILPPVSFALRVVLWELEKPRSRGVFILDEPLKGSLGSDELERAIEMFKTISHKLGFQLIIITHEKKLVNIADRAFIVKHDGTKSNVSLFKGE